VTSRLQTAELKSRILIQEPEQTTAVMFISPERTEATQFSLSNSRES